MSKKKQAARVGHENPASVFSAPVRLPRGWASAVVSGGRLVAVEWEATKETLLGVLAMRYPEAQAVAAEGLEAGRFLRDYAEGKAANAGEIGALPIAWETVPGFHQAVLRQTVTIPYGKTVTYGQLAAMAGRPRASRAAGTALARNPWPVIVPCHRVVGADGRLGGFGKGIETKRTLLRFEER